MNIDYISVHPAHVSYRNEGVSPTPGDVRVAFFKDPGDLELYMGLSFRDTEENTGHVLFSVIEPWDLANDDLQVARLVEKHEALQKLRMEAFFND